MRLRPFLKQWMLFGSLIVLALGLTGCVYLRLLELKNQLAEFDKNFETEVYEETFVLHFKNPMLYEKDIAFLTEVEPSQREPLKEGEKWVYAFARHSLDDSPQPSGPDLVFTLTTNQENKLNSIQFSEVFLQIIPPDFLELSIRSLGSAEIDKSKRHIYSKIDHVDPELLNLPSRQKIIKQLGEPNQVQQAEPNSTLLVYNYLMRGMEPTQKAEASGTAKAELYFDNQTDHLVETKCRFAGMKLSIDYRKWLEDDDDEATPVSSS